MSKVIDENLSISGDQSQGMDWKSKLSLALIVIGVTLFAWAIYKAGEGTSYLKIIGFLITIGGSGLFFSNKWYLSLGSILFVLGIVTMYYGYSLDKAESSILGGAPVKAKYAYAMVGFLVMIGATMLFTFDENKKYSFSTHYFKYTNWTQRVGLLFASGGVAIMLVAWLGKIDLNPSWLYLLLLMSLMTVGILLYTIGAYKGHPAGIKNNHVMFNSLSARGLIGFAAGILLTMFYVQLYWHSEPLTELIALFDAYSMFRNGGPASKWFVYGALYSFVILF